VEDKRARKVTFASHSLSEDFQKLQNGSFEEKQLAHEVQNAIDELYTNPMAGIKVPKQLWPREYLKKYSINNLRKYDLREGWRLIYTLKGNEIEIIAIMLEWLSHKEYEKRFGYKVQ